MQLVFVVVPGCQDCTLLGLWPHKEKLLSIAAIVLLFLVALIVFFQPFRRQYRVYNTIHALLFLNLAMFFMTVVFTNRSRLTAFAIAMSAVAAILPLFYIISLVFN